MLFRSASAMKMHVMAAKAQAAQNALGEFVFSADRFGYVYRLRRVTAGLMRTKVKGFIAHEFVSLLSLVR